MAGLNLNSGVAEIKKKNNTAVASKTTMNFAHHKAKVNPVRLAIALVLVIAVVGAFVKFGFIDQNTKLVIAAQERDEKQATLDAMNTKLLGYDELAEEYARYSYGLMTDSEKSLVPRLQVIDILEKYVMPVADIDDFTVTGNVVSLNILGATLEQASGIVDKLEGDPLVISASVYTASADTEDNDKGKKNDKDDETVTDDEEEIKNTKIFMSIVLTKEAAE